MQKVIIDTNVVVSAALSDKGNSSKIMSLVLNKQIYIYYSREIMDEYMEVLSRPRLNIIAEKQQYLLDGIKMIGGLHTPKVSDIPLPDETDRVFYDLAKEVGAIIITGNRKHYPDEEFVMTPSEFLDHIDYEH
ncbi:MAG: putative toxin-antitoxin system toxin component, PIN family [Oscillospiraceae bacterium]|nr:putative toxin-antitoxin system toxin component, PIN family [Oscillospiraceae bacterium]